MRLLRTDVDAAIEALRALPARKKPTLRDVVVHHYDDIVAKQDQGMTWAEIRTAIPDLQPISQRTIANALVAERERRSAAAVSAQFERITSLRASDLGWADILAKLPGLAPDAKTLRQLYTAESRQRPSAGTSASGRVKA
jgi:hypothetical protein